MPSLSSFGSGGVPLGGGVVVDERTSPGILRSGAQEFLLQGAIIPYSADYDPFLAVSRKYSEKGCAQRSIGATLSIASNSRCGRVIWDGSIYRAIAGNTTVVHQTSADGITWSAGTTSAASGAVNDVAMLGSTVAVASSTSSPFYFRFTAGSGAAPTAAGTPGTVVPYIIAGSPSLLVSANPGVVIQGGSAVGTSPDANVWTNRTCTGTGMTTNHYMMGVKWFPGASSFIHYVAPSASGSGQVVNLVRTTDGFTGLSSTSFFSSVSLNGTNPDPHRMMAASPTACVVGLGGGRLARTTDGINWTEFSLLSSAGGVQSLSAIEWDGNHEVFWAVGLNVSMAGLAQEQTWWSSDGLNWQQASYFYPVDVQDALTFGRPPFGVNAQTFWVQGASSSFGNSFLALPNPSDAPDYIGRQEQAPLASGSDFTLAIRIK